MGTKTDKLLEAACRLRVYYHDDQHTAADEVNRTLLEFMAAAHAHSPKAYREAETVMRAYVQQYAPEGHFLATLNNVIGWLQWL